MKSFSRRVLRIIAFLVVPLIASATAPMLSACGAGAFCKVCSEGKACGDTCIAKNETCTKGTGCACNG
jgi:hypothetical protein